MNPVTWTITDSKPSKMLETFRVWDKQWSNICQHFGPDRAYYADEFVAYFESWMPGEGFAIAELLAPFYSSRLSFELQAIDPQTEKFISRRVPWRACKGVKVVHQVGAQPGVALWAEAGQHSYVKEELKARLGEDKFYRIQGIEYICHDKIFGKEMADIIAGDRGPYAANDLKHFLGVTFNHSFRNRADSYIIKGRVEDLIESLVYAICFRLLKDTEKNLEGLLKLWRNGNLPLGFDADGMLVVLCAEPQKIDDPAARGIPDYMGRDAEYHRIKSQQ